MPIGSKLETVPDEDDQFHNLKGLGFNLKFN